MQTLNYKRINWQIEAVNLLLVTGETALAFREDMLPRILPGLIVQVCTYALLSLVYYFILGPMVLFPKTNMAVPLKKVDITEKESLRHIKRGIIYFNSTKLIISFLITSNILIQIYKLTGYYTVFSLIILVALLFYLIVIFTRQMASAKGYVITSNKELLQNFIFYFNPADKRTVVDKPMGMGSTINLATKDGKMILGVILAIPVAIIAMLLIALALAGKL
ncbi:MAG: hypothetical protein ACM3QX_09845 [Syntrophomonadaceae bacterium]